MPRESSLKRVLFDCGTRDATASAGLFVLRASVGLMMLLGHGSSKLRGFQDMKDGFYVPDFFPFSLMSPPVSLMLTIGAEVGAAALLVLGLMTRPAAFVLGFAMVVAAFGVHGTHPWVSMGGPSKEMALLYLFPVLAILLSGAGGLSLDAAIYQEKKRQYW
ncbi:MAG: DoxX family protein [Verrucomicrobia bacterium]|nr:DoxX family protein [Verrucomicrobiota bacterium]